MIKILLSITWVEWIGVVGFISNVWGNLMLARLKTSGWIVRLATNVLWVIYSSFTDGGWPLMVNHLTFFYINIEGWLKWNKAKKEGNQLQ